MAIIFALFRVSMDKALLKILLTSLPGRYARALFLCAEKEGILDSVSQDLNKLDHLRTSQQRIWQALASGVLNDRQKFELWQGLGKKMHLHPPVVNFCMLLAQQKRLELWPSILHIYDILHRTKKGQRNVLVQTATPMSVNEQENLSKTLKKIWKDHLILTFQVNPTLQAGLVVESDCLRLDASFHSHITSLTAALKGKYNASTRH